MTFRPADGRQNSVTAELDGEGRYSATLPTGEVTVTIDNRELEPRSNIPSLPAGIPLSRGGAVPRLDPERRPAPARRKEWRIPGRMLRRPSGRYMPIPPKYYEAETSGLKFTVKGGDQPFDIELTD